jgi:chemotaxis protein MotB
MHVEGGGGHERWLVSYADFITLLFAFFVLMYAIAMQDKKKAQDIAEAMRQSLVANGIVPDKVAGAAPQGDANKKTQSSDSHGTSMAGDLSSTADLLKESIFADPVPHFQPGQIDVLVDNRGVVVRLSASAFFRGGEAAVMPTAVPVLDQIALILKKSTREIRVEGHTDSVPLKSDIYATNWELSAARATWVVRYLVTKHGLAPERLSAAGFAGYRPITTDDTPEARAKNRRVEIVVVGP